MEPDSTLSPALLRKVVHAGTRASSFRAAANDLQVLAEVKISEARVRRATERVGCERVAETAAAAKAFAELPLPKQQQSPGPLPPEVACVQADGGRIQIRPRVPKSAKDQPGAQWWRETKVGCLLRLTSDRHAHDPTPTLPDVYLDFAHMAKMVREIKGFAGAVGDDEVAESPPENVHEAPLLVNQTVVATRENAEVFGARLAAAAHAEGFAAASRKAFVADGSETNWGIWRREFSHYTPILDWIHALCYVYAAALSGVHPREGWTTYCRWAQWLWSGEVERILEELRARQSLLGTPATEDAETSPRQRVADALRYLDNQRARMNYPEYRRQGLPLTSSYVESTIKCLNRRVKGTEKFWSGGAEPLLHLVADDLSPIAVLENFWNSRTGHLNSQRQYAAAA